MASYTSNQLYGAGTPIEALTSGSTYTFAITSSATGSAYFTLETVRNPLGFYGSTSATTARGTFGSLTNITGLVSSSYVFSVIVNQGGGSFTFTPAANIAASGSFLRGTGGISLTIS
jgi:adhesin HecA-like repeat protein